MKYMLNRINRRETSDFYPHAIILDRVICKYKIIAMSFYRNLYRTYTSGAHKAVKDISTQQKTNIEVSSFSREKIVSLQ